MVLRDRVEVPEEESTIFTIHFMMNDGNILVLQRILGHASIVDTMKYSHFTPEHLEDAVRLNPLAEK